MIIDMISKGSGGGYTLVTKPTISGNSFTYNGSAQGPTITWSTGMEDYCNVVNATATDVGIYTLTISLKDTSTSLWDDATTADVTYTYSINKIPVTKPTISGTSFTYNGSAQGPTITFATGMAQYCDVTNGTNTPAGSYTAVVSLKNTTNTEWADHTTANITQAYTINKATPTVTLNPTSMTLNTSTTSKAIAVSWTGDGASASIASSNTSLATVSPATLSAAGNTTVIAKGTTGSVTITVTVAAGTNYNSASATCSVTCSFVPLKTFSAATEAELLQMVQAADEGQIDLYTDCGWRVGQERSVSLSAIAASGTYDGTSWTVGESQAAQTITLVLMNQGGKELVTAVKSKGGATRTTCSFVVGVKHNLTTNGHMNSTNTNSGSWNASARRNWCNAGFRQALPANIRNCFKKFKTVTGDYNGAQAGGTNITSQDYFALPAEKEVFGSATYSTTNEAGALTQFTWYATAANRIKNTGSSAIAWWERSPYYAGGLYFCNVRTNGTATGYAASDALGLSPFGCL